MGNLLDLQNDSVQAAMLDGLMNAFRKELSDKLMPIAIAEVEKIVESIGKQMELRVKSYMDRDEGFREIEKIQLSWIFTTKKD